MTTKPWAAIALIMCGTLLLAPSAGAKEAAKSPGEQAYRSYGCAACHGTTGAGGGWQGPKLAPAPLPYEAFIAQLREPASKMPRYSEQMLPDATVRQIHDYLLTIRPGPRAADIPMLNRP